MKRHITLYKKMITFALSFAMIAGVWGGIGINAKAEGRIKRENDLAEGDPLYEGDTIEFELDDNSILHVCIYYFNRSGEGDYGGTLLRKDYYSGIKIQLPEVKYIRYGETKEYKYNVYKYRGSRKDYDSSNTWIFFIEVGCYGGNTPGGNTPGENTPGENTSGENTPGGNTPGENTSGGNTPGENTPDENTPGGNTSGEELAENNPAKENSNVSSESTTSDTGNNVASHTCNFEWVITVDPTTGGDGLEEYMCTGCGAVSQSHPIAASVAVIKDFYGNVKEAPENGSITYDSGKLYTISDYILKKMAERNDVSVTVKFEYQNKKYQLTFPAGLNYSAVLTDEETMYGYFGVAAKLGLKVAEQ